MFARHSYSGQGPLGSLHMIPYALRKAHCCSKHMQWFHPRKTSNEASGVLALWEVR